MNVRTLAKSGVAVAGLPLALAACRTPDPRQELELTGVETYWAIDAPAGQTQFIAPVVRFQLHNKGRKAQRALSVTATFWRRGDTTSWSSAYHQVAPPGKPFAPGETRLVVLKPEGEGRYSSPGDPVAMLQHPLFKDVRAEVFLRMGAGSWVKFVDTDVERRIGPRGETK